MSFAKSFESNCMHNCQAGSYNPDCAVLIEADGKDKLY
jgi:hypothetical protein